MSMEVVYVEDEIFPPPEDERRATLREGARGRALCRIAGTTAAAWAAPIRDVSPLGIGLVLPAPIPVGGVLDVILESPDGAEVRSALARVIHIEENGDESWLVGCAFVAELSAAELREFQAEKTRPTDTDNRRWVRFPCNVETVCYTRETTPGERRPVRILNISAGGVGLLCPCDFCVGTLLHLELPVEAARLALIRIVRVVEHTAGGWFLGCEFVDVLPADELRELL